jgi:hypothetical protein
MASLSSELLNILGKEINSLEVREVINRFNLSFNTEDPPFRHYIGSKELGLSLLFHNDQLIDVQFFLKPTKLFQAFDLSLPYDLAKGMTQKEIHQLLGDPLKSDETHSKYLMPRDGVNLTVEFDKNNIIRYMSAALLT